MSDWVPEFPGQRPPFAPGNQVSLGNRGPLLHGAYSVRHVEALAEQIAAEMRADIDYLRAPRFAERLGAYSRAEARARLYGAWVESLTIAEAATNPDGDPPLEVLRKLQTRAGNVADLIGLSPLGASAIADDIAAARKTLAKRAERDQLQTDLVEAAREAWFSDE